MRKEFETKSLASAEELAKLKCQLSEFAKLEIKNLGKGTKSLKRCL
jgi:hypothetical protein